ncbi:MAG: hypothetical protein ABWY25_11510, partial [Paenisporosarcina sp.]
IANQTTKGTKFGWQKGKSSPLGQGGMSPTRGSLIGDYMLNQTNPAFKYVVDFLNASQERPFDVLDQTLQQVVPLFTSDVFDAAESDHYVAAAFAGLLASIGIGAQTYEKGDYGRPTITPHIERAIPGFKSPTIGGK